MQRSLQMARTGESDFALTGYAVSSCRDPHGNSYPSDGRPKSSTTGAFLPIHRLMVRLAVFVGPSRRQPVPSDGIVEHPTEKGLRLAGRVDLPATS
jgi:hypothetical protein